MQNGNDIKLLNFVLGEKAKEYEKMTYNFDISLADLKNLLDGREQIIEVNGSKFLIRPVRGNPGPIVSPVKGAQGPQPHDHAFNVFSNGGPICAKCGLSIHDYNAAPQDHLKCTPTKAPAIKPSKYKSRAPADKMVAEYFKTNSKLDNIELGRMLENLGYKGGSMKNLRPKIFQDYAKTGKYKIVEISQTKRYLEKI